MVEKVNKQKELTELNSNLPSGIFENNYSMPNNYFTELPDAIVEKVKDIDTDTEAELEFSTFTQGEKNTNKVVPINYFNSLPSLILDKINKKNLPAAINRKKKMVSFAIAATCITLLGLILFFSKKDNFIQSRNGLSNSNLSKMNNVRNALTVENNLENINDEEIVLFLKENGHDINAAVIASLTDDILLPGMNDYFCDQITLNKYLYNSINQ